MLKSYGWGGGVGWGGVVVAHVILVSAQGPNPSFFLFLGGGNFIRLGGLFGPGLGLGLRPGLDSLSVYRPDAQKVDDEGGDEEAGGQVKELGALLDQTSGISDVNESEHDRLLLFMTMTNTYCQARV